MTRKVIMRLVWDAVEPNARRITPEAAKHRKYRLVAKKEMKRKEMWKIDWKVTFTVYVSSATHVWFVIIAGEGVQVVKTRSVVWYFFIFLLY